MMAQAPANLRPLLRFSWVDVLRDLPLRLGRCDVYVGDRIVDQGWGRDDNPRKARAKARSEAIERLAYRSPAGLRRARAGDLEGALDPRALVAYAPQQYRRAGFPFAPFDPRREYLWKRGVDARSGRPVDVLADCVYAPGALERVFARPLYTGATTSGCATASSWSDAVERAALELVERDAFMRCWASQRGGAELRTRSLPGAVRRRIERLRARGCRVSLQRLPSRFAFVTLALVQSECARFTCVGTAASRDPERAVVSAMGEAECLAWACLAGYGRRSVRPAQVRTGWDHADLYTNPEYFRRADCLLRSRRGSEALRSPKRLPESTDNFLSELADWAGALVVINLSLPDVGLGRRLSTVRVMVPRLIPLTFGRSCLPLGMMSDVKRGARFPHPLA